jgi:hypothetical protein
MHSGIKKQRKSDASSAAKVEQKNQGYAQYKNNRNTGYPVFGFRFPDWFRSPNAVFYRAGKQVAVRF